MNDGAWIEASCSVSASGESQWVEPTSRVVDPEAFACHNLDLDRVRCGSWICSRWVEGS
jgi:hypothetical protein